MNHCYLSHSQRFFFRRSKFTKIVWFYPPPGIKFYLAWLEIIFHTVLEAFSFGLQGGHDEAVPHEVRRVTDSFTGPKTAAGSKGVKDSSQ